MTDEMNIVETPDLYFAAFLQAKSCEIINTKKEGNRTIFYFKVPKDKDYKSAYFNQKEDADGMVSGCKYSNAIKNLKTLCYVKDDN
jgi:hypothetical protein